MELRGQARAEGREEGPVPSESLYTVSGLIRASYYESSISTARRGGGHPEPGRGQLLVRSLSPRETYRYRDEGKRERGEKRW